MSSCSASPSEVAPVSSLCPPPPCSAGFAISCWSLCIWMSLLVLAQSVSTPFRSPTKRIVQQNQFVYLVCMLVHSSTLVLLGSALILTFTGLSHIIKTRKVLDLRIDLRPSYFLLPKSGLYSQTSELIIIDFGSFQVSSFSGTRKVMKWSWCQEVAAGVRCHSPWQGSVGAWLYHTLLGRPGLM